MNMKRFISNLSVEINITLFSIQSRHRGNVVLLRILTLMVFFVTTFLSQQAMAKKLHTPCVACSISGTTPVTQGNTATYTLAGSCSATSWTVTCGTIQSSSSSSVTIYFNVLGCTSSVITALNGTTTLATKTITVNAAPVSATPLKPSTLAPCPHRSMHRSLPEAHVVEHIHINGTVPRTIAPGRSSVEQPDKTTSLEHLLQLSILKD